MATKTKSTPKVRIETRNGKKYAVMPITDFRRLQRAAAPSSDRPNPPARPPIAGVVDALAFADATIAESIVRDRQVVGLSQRQLAGRAGIRVEVLNRAENGVVVPSVRTLTKIENALIAAGLKRVPHR
jgi:ribosome-binding protein aMBF1 (putative translation factor)